VARSARSTRVQTSDASGTWATRPSGVGDQPQVADVVGLEHGLGDLVLADPGGQQLGASRWVSGVVAWYWKRPVSVTSPV
jgi:hypothetical protein